MLREERADFRRAEIAKPFVIMKSVLALLFFAVGTSAAQLNSEFPLDVLKEQYEKELLEASKPVAAAHLKRLERLKKQLVKDERLKEAVAVDEEIARVRDRVVHAELYKSLEGTWAFSTTRKTFHIGADGTLYNGGENPRVVIVDPKKRVVRVAAHLYILSEDGMSLTGKDLDGGSRHPAKKRG